MYARLPIFGALLLPLQAAPVINEIHYNNDDNTVLNEFVEIHNPDSVGRSERLGT